MSEALKRLEKEMRIATVKTENRAEEEQDKMVLSGYALTFDNKTRIGDDPEYCFDEVILTGALDGTDMKKVPLKYNHDNGYLAIASTKNGSLRLRVDKKGLYFEADLIETPHNRSIYEAVKSGLVNECSFAFTIEKADWDFDTEVPLRMIQKIKRLYDVALVDLPAYDNTEVYARSFRELEDARNTVEAVKQREDDIRQRLKIKIKIGGNTQ